jgi:hypothetical protein
MGYTFFLDLMAGFDTFGSHSIAQDHISNTGSPEEDGELNFVSLL